MDNHPHGTNQAGNPCAPGPDELTERGKAVLRALVANRWYAVPDDLIGGYAVANVPLPASAHRPAEGHVTAGDFLSQAVAEHVADLHNAWLTEGPSQAYLAELAERNRTRRAQALCQQPHGTTPCTVCGATWRPGDPVHPNPGLDNDPGKRCITPGCATTFWPGDLPQCPTCQQRNPDSPHTWQTYPTPKGGLTVHVERADQAGTQTYALGAEQAVVPASVDVALDWPHPKPGPDLGDDPDGDIEGADYPPFPAGYTGMRFDPPDRDKID